MGPPLLPPVTPLSPSSRYWSTHARSWKRCRTTWVLASLPPGVPRLHQVLLALYGRATPLIDTFQLGLRLPNTAPVAACFTAFSPAKYLEAWLTRAHESRGGYNEKLDQKLRVSLIAIRARGYEVTLKTKAEAELTRELGRIHNSWSLTELEEACQQIPARPL